MSHSAADRNRILKRITLRGERIARLFYKAALFYKEFFIKTAK